VGHVTCKGELRNVYRVLVLGPLVKTHWEDLGIDGSIMLSCTIEK
jgi:hypothetical protein